MGGSGKRQLADGLPIRHRQAPKTPLAAATQNQPDWSGRRTPRADHGAFMPAEASRPDDMAFGQDRQLK